MWYRQLQGTESTISCAFYPYPNLSTRLLYMNVSFLAISCESQVFYIWDEDMTAAGNEAETSTSSARRLWLFYFNKHYFIYPLYWRDWLKVWRLLFFVFAILRCSVLFWFSKIRVICFSHKSALFCFCCTFCALSWTFVTSCLPWCL